MKYFLALLSILACTGLSALEFRDADIVVAPGAPVSVQFAANELSYHLQKLTGGAFPVRNEPSSDRVVIRLGDTAESRGAGADLNTLKYDGFYLGAIGQEVLISGVDSRENNSSQPFPLLFSTQQKGSLYGVYEFLEQQGIRWPAPGKQFEFIPTQKVVHIAEGLKKHEPVFPDREAFPNWKLASSYPDAKEYSDNDDDFYIWMMRLRLRGRSIYPGSHAQYYMDFPRIWWNEHPERFQWKNGRRIKDFLCWTDPAVEEAWYRCADAYFSGKKPNAAGFPHLKHWPGQQYPDQFCIEPADNQAANDGRCDCERCQAFRKKYPSKYGDDTELMWHVISNIAQRIRIAHPGKLIVTLAYPPKAGFPETVHLPDNVRVVVCPIGAGELPLPERFNPEHELLQKWSQALGPDNIVLRTYQIESFGRKVPGIPDIYPQLQLEYLQRIRGLCAGVNNEIVCSTFTARNADVYLMSRFLWNPERNAEQEFAEFFRTLYGPAADTVQQIFARFDANYRRYVQLGKRGVIEKVGVAAEGGKLRRVLWTKVYTDDEISTLDRLAADAFRAVAGQDEYTRRVNLLNTHILGLMKAERNEAILPPELPEVHLENAKWSSERILHSADRAGMPTVATTFKLKATNNMLHITVKCVEPEPDNSICSDRPSGDPELWRDDDIELFVFSAGTLRQIIVNSKGAFSCLEESARAKVWGNAPDVTVISENTQTGRRVDISLTLPEKFFRLNLTRYRKVQGAPEELSTWSPAAKRGNWRNPDIWGRIFVP